MKKLLCFFTCVFCLLLTACTPAGPLMDGLYYCEELNCYIEITSQEKIHVPDPRLPNIRGPVLIQEDGTVVQDTPEPYTYIDRTYRGWYIDQDNQTHTLGVTNPPGIPKRNIYLIPTNDPEGELHLINAWIQGTLEKSTEEKIVIKCHIGDKQTRAFDQNKDRKFIFNRVEE